MLTEHDTGDSAVSPVIAVILLVAVTVALSAVIGTFALDIGQTVTDDGAQQSIGVSTSQSGGQYSATIVTGSADEVRLLVNGSVVDSATNPSPGDSLSGNVTSSSDVTVVSVSDGEKSVVSTDESVSTTSSTQGETAPTAGLISHWTFDESSDSTVYDVAGGDDGSLTSSSAYTTGVDGSALHAAGSEHAEMSDNASLDFGSGDSFTIAAWINTTSDTNPQSIVAKRPAQDTGYIFFVRPDSSGKFLGMKIGDGTNTAGVQAGSNSSIDGTWHHGVVVVNRSSSEMVVYIDGEFDNRASFSSVGGLESAENFRIGNSTTSGNEYNMEGALDEVRMYNRTLNESEVSDLYNATK